MKRFVHVILAFALGLAMAGCAKEYDDTALKGKVDELSKQVSDLAQKVNDMNAQVVGMKETLDQWKAGGYIVSIDDSVEGQHTITFLGGKTVVLYDGDQGEAGGAPAITIKEEDGEYYWYVGDEKLAPASYTPVFKINDEGELVVIVNGKETNLGVVHGFQNIEKTDHGTVVFSIDEENSFEIPLAKAFKLVIADTEKQISGGEVMEFPYTVENGNATTVVDAFAGGNYKVAVEAEKVKVTVPTPAVDGQVLVWAQNGEGLFSMVKLSFTIGEITPEVTVTATSEELTAIPDTGGPVTVSLVSNVEVEVETPAVDWVKAVLTKAEYTLTLTVDPNTEKTPRETEIKILRADTKAPVQTIKIAQLPAHDASAVVKRVWGKYSTEAASWSAYLPDFHAQGDRNVTMDDNYIFVADASNKVKALYAIDKKDGSFYKNLSVEGVLDNYFPLCCPRVMKLGEESVLVVAGMTMDASSDPVGLYVYENGIDAAPTVVKLTGGAGRLGDTFSFWGAGATNSSDGQGLSKGMLYFDAMGAGDGVRIWKTVLTKGSLPQTLEVQVRYGFDNENTAVGAFWTYPGNKDAGIWAGRGDTKSVYGSVAEGAPNLWTAGGNQVANTVCQVINNGYYNNVTAYQFFTFHGKRYIAYTKQVSNADGRLIVLEGAETDAWSDILAAHTVTYQAAIQSGDENKDAYEESPKASGNSGMDLCIRAVGEGIDIVVIKQNVGLSLFRMTFE